MTDTSLPPPSGPFPGDSRPAGLAAERVRAAAEAAHRGPVRLVLTARAENYLHGRPDLADTIARLQAYQEAGADSTRSTSTTSSNSRASMRSTSRWSASGLSRP